MNIKQSLEELKIFLYEWLEQILPYKCMRPELIRWIFKKQASPVAQRLKRLPAMRETWVQSLGWEDPLEKAMATHSSVHWTSSVHSQAHTLEQSFSELCMQLTWEFCSIADSDSIGLRGRALGLLISAISQVMLMHWYTDHPLSSKTLGLIIT